MEDKFDKVARMLGELERALGGYEELGDGLEALRAYMDSGQWKEDYEADEAGQIPANLKRGVLSQDGLYNLLQDADTIITRAREVLGAKE